MNKNDYNDARNREHENATIPKGGRWMDNYLNGIPELGNGSITTPDL